MTKAELHAAATQTSTAAVVTEEVSRLACIKFCFLSFPLAQLPRFAFFLGPFAPVFSG